MQTNQAQPASPIEAPHLENVFMVAPSVSTGKVSESEVECGDSESEDDLSLCSFNLNEGGDGTSHSSMQKKRAAIASLEDDEPETKNKKLRANHKQKYRIGTVIMKAFQVPGQNKWQHFRGEVKEYFSDVQEYRIVYEDGDSEHMTESDVAMGKLLLTASEIKHDYEDGANVDDEYEKTPKLANNAVTVNRVKMERLDIGDVVYSTYGEAKKRNQDNIFRRGRVEAMKQTRGSFSYDILFDDGKCLASIDSSLVIPEHHYLYENLKQGLEVGQRVVAGWWENAHDTSSPPAGWYPGAVKASKQQQGGKFGPNRFYDIKFDDGDELDDIEDIFVWDKDEYKLLCRERRGETSAWKGVKNILDKDSTDRWAQTVGYWELEGKNDGNDKAIPFLGDALRCYDDRIVSYKGANTKEADLNLPEEWIFESDAKSPPTRSLVGSPYNDTSRSRARPLPLPMPLEEPNNDGKKGKSERPSRTSGLVSKSSKEDEDKGTVSRSLSLSGTPVQRKEAAATATVPRGVSMSLMTPFYEAPVALKEQQRRIKVVEYVSPAKSQVMKRMEPIIGRGEHVYAILSGVSASSSEVTLEWSPGRVWDSRVTHESSYGPVKTYDIIFNNGEVEQNLSEVFVMKEEDYKVFSAMPKESWIGVVNYTDPNSDDDYARSVGWYGTNCGGEHQVYSSISNAFRAYNKYVVSMRQRIFPAAVGRAHFPSEMLCRLCSA